MSKFERFKAGVEAITPLQHAKISLIGQIIVIAGILIGLWASFISGLVWLFTILIGSLIVSVMGTLAQIQKYIVFKRMADLTSTLNAIREVKNEQISPV